MRLIHDQNLEELVLSAGIDGHITVPDHIRLVRMGRNRTTKGDYFVTPEGLQTVIANFKALERDLVFDYEHQTLKDVEAPASGWIKDLEAAPDGLWARVEWTAKAREYIAAKEYRYFSPVVYPHKTSRIMSALGSVALTNDPATTGADPIVNKDNFETEEPMREALIQLLGLDPAVTDDDLVAVIRSMKDKLGEAEAEIAAKADVADSAIQALALKADAKGADVRGAVIALKNPDGHVSIEEFRALKAQVADRDAEELVALALKDGKISPAQRDWAKAYALKDGEGFGAFVAAAPRVVDTGMSAGAGSRQGAGVSKLTEAEALVCKQMGLSEETFLAHNQER